MCARYLYAGIARITQAYEKLGLFSDITIITNASNSISSQKVFLISDELSYCYVITNSTDEGHIII